MEPPGPTKGAYIEVAAGLVFRSGKLLITRRLAGGHLGGLWEFPGGKREHGETFEACLERELREELGIEVAVRDWIETIAHSYPEKNVLLKFFRCQWLAHDPRALGCQAYAWVDPSELCAFQFPDADAKLIERLKTTPNLWVAPVDQEQREGVDRRSRTPTQGSSSNGWE